MFELFSDMYFVVYKLYYFGQNDDLGIRVRLRNWNGGSTIFLGIQCCTIRYLHVSKSIFIMVYIVIFISLYLFIVNDVEKSSTTYTILRRICDINTPGGACWVTYIF
jgi:hypothetical protein